MREIIIFLLALISAPLFCFADADKSTSELYNSVHFAENGNDIVVDLNNIKYLLDNGANPNWIDTEHLRRQSILYRYVDLVSYSREPNTTQKGMMAIKLLLARGAKLQYCDKTILFFPIANGKEEIVRLLLENGASATFWPKEEIGSDYKGTPIVEATARGDEKVIELLVAHGAKRLPEKEAVQIRFVYAAQYENVEVLKELVEKGAEVNIRNQDNKTALLNALSGPGLYYYDTYRKIIYLLDLGADLNQSGRTLGHEDTLPLHQVIWSSSFAFKSENDEFNIKKSRSQEILKELIKRGAFISGRDKYERTPLHIAAKYNNLVAAKMLIEAGAKLMDKDREGKTPLDYAESAEMIELLKAQGAKEQ
ncbi:MAG: hypothetical protein CVV39_04710 [Planctomycetes bacterium HGW-Planctomycetes-1]|nr:MAG: hypothetical protein CVV39_04710 [Planctomycetes bacterium HGW-Planctomycetes-1]